jgi:hypothetical protein
VVPFIWKLQLICALITFSLFLGNEKKRNTGSSGEDKSAGGAFNGEENRQIHQFFLSVRGGIPVRVDSLDPKTQVVTPGKARTGLSERSGMNSSSQKRVADEKAATVMQREDRLVAAAKANAVEDTLAAAAEAWEDEWFVAAVEAVEEDYRLVAAEAIENATPITTEPFFLTPAWFRWDNREVKLPATVMPPFNCRLGSV